MKGTGQQHADRVTTGESPENTYINHNKDRIKICQKTRQKMFHIETTE